MIVDVLELVDLVVSTFCVRCVVWIDVRVNYLHLTIARIVHRHVLSINLKIGPFGAVTIFDLVGEVVEPIVAGFAHIESEQAPVNLGIVLMHDRVESVVQSGGDLVGLEKHHISLCPVVRGLLVVNLVYDLLENRRSEVVLSSQVLGHLHGKDCPQTPIVHVMDSFELVDEFALLVVLTRHNVERIHAN